MHLGNLGHDIHCGDVWQAVDTMPKTADVLIGGFPCQDVSLNEKRAGINGNRSGLYKAMVEAIRRLKPHIFVAENVKGLLLKYNEASLRQVIADFKGLGYEVHYKLYKAAEYGIPQTRESLHRRDGCPHQAFCATRRCSIRGRLDDGERRSIRSCKAG